MTRVLLPSCLAVVLAGCITTGPPDNADFGAVAGIKDLEGAYQNLGVREAGGLPLYLSHVIWPTDDALEHDAIAIIEVKSRDQDTLVVAASDQDGVVMKEAAFVEGQDFEIESGRILLSQESRFLGFKSGDPAIGPYFGRTVLGIDTVGDAKFSDQSEFIGMVMAVIPLALGLREEVRFVRLDAVKARRGSVPARD